MYDSIRSEVDFDVHCAIGLGRRMPIPPQLNLERAYMLKQQISSWVVQIWGDNTAEEYDPEMLLKVAQCAAEDELF